MELLYQKKPVRKYAKIEEKTILSHLKIIRISFYGCVQD